MKSQWSRRAWCNRITENINFLREAQSEICQIDITRDDLELQNVRRLISGLEFEHITIRPPPVKTSDSSIEPFFTHQSFQLTTYQVWHEGSAFEFWPWSPGPPCCPGGPSAPALPGRPGSPGRPLGPGGPTTPRRYQADRWGQGQEVVNEPSQSSTFCLLHCRIIYDN